MNGFDKWFLLRLVVFAVCFNVMLSQQVWNKPVSYFGYFLLGTLVVSCMLGTESK